MDAIPWQIGGVWWWVDPNTLEPIQAMTAEETARQTAGVTQPAPVVSKEPPATPGTNTSLPRGATNTRWVEPTKTKAGHWETQETSMGQTRWRDMTFDEFQAAEWQLEPGPLSRDRSRS